MLFLVLSFNLKIKANIFFTLTYPYINIKSEEVILKNFEFDFQQK